jgi:hypothetical protein
MKYAIEIGSVAMICILSFLIIGSGIQKLIEEEGFTAYFYFFQNKTNRLIIIMIMITIKAIPVTGRGGSLGCETLRFPHFPDSRLTDGC